MNAKEWIGENTNDSVQDWMLENMERYASYKNKEFHKKLMEWRENYLQHWSKLENNEAEFALYLLDQFDLHFNLREI